VTLTTHLIALLMLSMYEVIPCSWCGASFKYRDNLTFTFMFIPYLFGLVALHAVVLDFCHS
jgi:hypothetical protein